MKNLISGLYFSKIVKFPVLSVLVLVIILLSAIYNIKEFKLDASADSLILESDRDLIIYRDVMKKYSTEDQWEKGVIEGSFQETAFNKDGKFNVYLMDKVRALAGEESQNIEIIFISHDGETALILGNAFAEDLGFKNVSVLKGGVVQWLKEKRQLVPHKKIN